MKAAYVNQPGPAESIIVGELPRPEPAENQVLVRVRAAAVNPVDLYVRGGMVPGDLPTPYVIGCDLAGEVEAVGAEVIRFKPGDRVWGSNQGIGGRQGTYAEYTVVDEDWLYPTPSDVDDQTAAAGAMVGITAHLGLFAEADLQRGETILINGGSGGVGSTVLQLAKAAGARVIATAGSDENLAKCRALGADVALNYRTFSAEAIQGVEDVNVWWETTRSPDFDMIVTCLAPRGRIVLMAGREARPELPIGPFYTKGCSMHGFVIFNASADEQRDASGDINRWLSSGDYRPAIGRVMPLDEAAAAHKLQEENTLGGAGTLSGKIVITI